MADSNENGGTVTPYYHPDLADADEDDLLTTRLPITFDPSSPGSSREREHTYPEGSGTNGPTTSESDSIGSAEKSRGDGLANPLKKPLKDIASKGWGMLGLNPGTWISAAALLFIAVPILAILAGTFGSLEVANRGLGKQIKMIRLRLEDTDPSSMQKSGYLLALGVLYLIKFPFWLATAPFKIFSKLVDLVKGYALPDSPGFYAWAAFVLGIVGTVVYTIVY